MKDRMFNILVAFSVIAETREQAERMLMGYMPSVGAFGSECETPIDSWWVAEDDRRDGSDNDSAVYVPKGMQSDARRTLLQYLYTEEEALDQFNKWCEQFGWMGTVFTAEDIRNNIKGRITDETLLDPLTDETMAEAVESVMDSVEWRKHLTLDVMTHGLDLVDSAVDGWFGPWMEEKENN